MLDTFRIEVGFCLAFSLTLGELPLGFVPSIDFTPAEMMHTSL